MIAGIAREIAVTFMDMAPYMLLGLMFAGVLHVFIHRDFVAKHLGGSNVASVVKASLFGIPLPLCSCGVLPVALSLRKGKASDGATISFLISTPQTGIDSIAATWGMLGPVYAIFRPLAALVMGIVGGLAVIPFSSKHEHGADGGGKRFSCNLCFEPKPHSHPVSYRVRRALRYAFRDFLDDIAVQLTIGIAAAGIIAYFVPENFFARHVNNEFLSMVLMVVVGIPMYICATASIPVAVALMAKGLSPGAAFVFLAVGSATNISFILAVADVMGKKIVSVYLAVLTILSVAMGYVLNLVFALFGTQSLNGKLAHDFSEHVSPWTAALSALFLLILLLSLARVGREKIGDFLAGREHHHDHDEHAAVIAVEGMTCRTCGDKVVAEISKLHDVGSVTADIKASTVTITGHADREAVKKAVEAAGFELHEDR
jgi:uncharacterized protein